ncbi:MAG: hypothetical protein IKH04_13065 [Kiritimatiellae bacterium]|nr:hypothetical protein [Kiritimatiellia bacterium]
MTYEEYKQRMEAQGRKPVEIEHYDLVETAYMALANADKDEFCQLSDRMIADIRILANQRDSALTLLGATAGELGDLKGECAELEKERSDLKDMNAELEKELRRHEKLVSALLAELPAEKLRAFMLSMVDAD